MPLLSVVTLDADSDTRLALWKITEKPDAFFRALSFSSSERSEFICRYKSVSRQCEILAVKSLLGNLFNEDVLLLHNEVGCPILSNGYNISISHTNGLACVIISNKFSVSIDVERIRPRILNVVNKFLRPDECVESLNDALLHWCAKEAVYKLYSTDNLRLNEIRVNSVDDSNGIIRVENMRRKEEVKAMFDIFDGFILVLAYELIKK